MTAESSDILQPGAVIAAVQRLGPWLKITTNIGTIYFAGASVVKEQELECPRCRETRLCEVVVTGRWAVGYCKMCSEQFPLKDEAR